MPLPRDLVEPFSSPHALLNALCDLPNGMTCGIDDESHKRHDDCDGDNEHVFQNEAHVKRRREFHDSETEYGGKEGERCLEILARASEEAGSDVTKMMVTSVKRTMMLPCCLVDSAVHLADLASDTFACFCFRSSK